MKNRKRLLAVNEILRKYSDEDHPLSLEEIKNYLENEYRIFPVYRKSVNADIHTLEESTEAEIIYRHKHGYYYEEQPFSPGEMKILLDAVHSLQDLDESSLTRLHAKCLRFFSVHYSSFFQEITLPSRHGKNSFLYHLEVLLEAFRKKKSVLLTRKKKTEEILPLFFERVNDQYYLLYSYPHKAKIYRLLFRNIDKVLITEKSFIPPFNKEEILDYIQETHDAYHGEVLRIEIRLLKEEENVKRWLKNEFPQVEFYRDRAYLRSSGSPRLFASFAAYHNRIQILSPPELIADYTAYLKNILEIYQKGS